MISNIGLTQHIDKTVLFNHHKNSLFDRQLPDIPFIPVLKLQRVFWLLTGYVEGVPLLICLTFGKDCTPLGSSCLKMLSRLSQNLQLLKTSNVTLEMMVPFKNCKILQCTKYPLHSFSSLLELLLKMWSRVLSGIYITPSEKTIRQQSMLNLHHLKQRSCD